MYSLMTFLSSCPSLSFSSLLTAECTQRSRRGHHSQPFHVWPPAPAPRTSLPCSSSQGTLPGTPSDDDINSDGAGAGDGGVDGDGDGDGDCAGDCDEDV